MRGEIRADYSKTWLLPPSLDDWVDARHPARFVREFVESLDLAKMGFPVRVSFEGRPSYSSDLLLKIWVYGYLTRVRRSRQLEAECRSDVAMMWLAGTIVPDHNTLWRFWKGNRRSMRKLFKATVRVAARSGLIGMVVHAIDGTKIAARGSGERMRKAEGLGRELAALDAAVEEVMAQIEEGEEREANQPGHELPVDWRETMLRREEIRELVGELEVTGRSTIHAGEREAHLMKTRSGGIRPAYNAQAVVDSTSGLIVAGEVLEDEADNHALVSVLDEVKENLGSVASETVADAGYHSGEELAACEGRGYSVVVAQPKSDEDDEQQGSKNAFSKTNFEFDREKDCCICPEGKTLRYLKTRVRQPGKGNGLAQEVRVYHCEQYASCPVRWSCSRSPRGRTVTIGRFHEPILRQRVKLEDPEKRALLRRRGTIIEPVFGWIKEGLGFRRFGSAGREGARAEWSMICTVIDLRKLYTHWKHGVAIAWA